MQEDINKTGQISQDEDNEEDGDVKTFKKLSDVQGNFFFSLLPAATVGRIWS